MPSDMKPLSVNFDRASQPPATTASQMPCSISRAASSMAFAAEEQAVLIVVV